MTNWNPSQYLRFENERLQPVIDLIGRIPLESPGVIYDLVCGTGSGKELFITPRTITTQVSNMRNKISAANRAEATDYAIRNGLV